MAYVLDTDSTSNFLEQGRNTSALRERVIAETPANIYITVITLEEILGGILNALTKARSAPRNAQKIIFFSAKLQQFAQDLLAFQILPYDEVAEEQFKQIPAPVRRKNSQDCHIAAIALSHGFTVVTSNTQDFEKIPGVSLADWMLEPPPL